MRFATFPIHLSKVLRLLRESDARSLRKKRCTCHAKSIQQTEDLMLQNATPLQRKAPPRPPNSSDENVSLYCTYHGKCIFADPLQMHHACHRFWKCYKTLTFCSLLTTWNEIWTSKSSPYIMFFVHFDFEMCFAPQRRALFRHLNFQKWSEREVFLTFFHLQMCFGQNGVHFFDIFNFQKRSEREVLLTFSLASVLRTKTERTFSTSQLPKMVRTWGAFNLFTYKCASGQNGVHFFDILNFQKWSECEVLLTFSLTSARSHQTERTFSTSQLPKMVRTWGAFNLFTYNSASGQNACTFRHLNFPKMSDLMLTKLSLTHVLLAKTSCTFSTSQLPKNGPNVRCF